MNVKKTMKRIGLVALVAGATLLPQKACSQVSSVKVDYMHPIKTQAQRIRPEVFYQLPGGVKGYTFVDFYTAHEDYFAKNFLSKTIKGSLDATVETIHGSQFTDQVGLGLKVNMPENDMFYGNAKLMPVYVDMGGEFQQEKIVMGYLVGTTLHVPLVGDIDICSFGEINLASEDGPTWQYGELSVTKSFGQLDIGLSVDLDSKGKAMPDPHVGFQIVYVFPDKTSN